MGRHRLMPGTRFVWNGHVHVVRQLLLDHQVLVEDQSAGGQQVVSSDELGDLWARGALCFEVQGQHTRPTTNNGLSTTYTIADFRLVPEAQRAEAWRRYTLIHPLLDLPSAERTRQIGLTLSA